MLPFWELNIWMTQCVERFNRPSGIHLQNHACRRIRRTAVKIKKQIHPPFGAIAQLGERIVRNDEVVGSSPTSSTNPRQATTTQRMVAGRLSPGSPCHRRRYFASGDSSRPRYFSIAFVLGGAPRQASYILARSSVLPRERTIWRKRSPLARLSSPCSTNHW